MATQRKFDVILYGASGFTGKLVCRHLAQSYGNSNIKWAMAGRNRQKLELVRDEISHINASCSTVPILVADAFDEVGLGALMKDTKVDEHQL